jgi:hypothetical protein
MAIEEAAAITVTANSTSTVPRFNEPIVMVRTESGAPFGPAQDSVPTLPESLSRYQVEAQLGSLPLYEPLRLSYREKIEKSGRRLDESPQRRALSRAALAQIAASAPRNPPAAMAGIPPLMRHGHVDIVA